MLALAHIGVKSFILSIIMIMLLITSKKSRGLHLIPDALMT